MRLAGQLGRRPGDRPVPALRDHRLLVKSVHAAMSVEWLAATFDLEVLVLLRHPGAVLASWQSLGLPEHLARLERVPEVRQRCEEWGVPLPGPDELEHTVWLLGVLLTSLEEAARRSGFVAAHPRADVRRRRQTNSARSIASSASSGRTGPTKQ